MKIMAWNCRGVNDADGSIVPFLCWSIRKYAPHIFFLNETKADNVVISRLAKTLNYA